MGSLYGPRWEKAYGAAVDPDGIWSLALHGIDEAQIRHGIEQCIKQGMRYPPSAPEFRALCLNPGGIEWADRRAQMVLFDRALPKPFDYAEGRRQVGKIRDLL